MSILTKAILGFIAFFLLICSVAGFFVARATAKNSVHKNKYALGAVGLWALFCAGLYVKTFVFLPLPSDEDMIKHFYAHRSEIEFLVKAYREFDQLSTPGNPALWDSDSKIQEIKKRANVRRLSEKNGWWHDVPYSQESADIFYKKIKSKEINPFTNHRYSGVIVPGYPRS